MGSWPTYNELTGVTAVTTPFLEHESKHPTILVTDLKTVWISLVFGDQFREI